MLEEMIKKARENRMARGRTTPDGAKEEDIEMLKAADVKEGNKIPDAYLDVLRKIDGYENNGYRLYGTEQGGRKGILSMNAIWHENQEQKKYLFLGESDISWYVYEIESQKYLELDKPSGEAYKEYGNAEGMAEEIIAQSM